MKNPTISTGKGLLIMLAVLVILPVACTAILGGGKKSAATQTQTTQKAAPSYEVVKRWSIPNGGEGQMIVVASGLSYDDMVALGERLKTDHAGDRNAFISVFTDRKAADLRDSVLADTASKEDQNFYDTHYVADYKKNGTTGFHQLNIFLDGVNGSSQQVSY